MVFIKDLTNGANVKSIYLCKQKSSAMTKTGKEYYNVVIQDKTGMMDMKIWDINSPGIREFEAKDYIEVVGSVTEFAGTLQLKADSVRKAEEGEYNPSDYLPVSERDPEDMYMDLLQFVDSVKNEYLNALLKKFYVEDEDLKDSFIKHSAAKSVHHVFVGGLLQHTLAVTHTCNFFSKLYPILNRDLLITAALLHDVGKTKELSVFPENDYTDEGNLLGHIVMGVEMIGERIKEIEGFPEVMANELKHCIVAHHGELEFGSPKKPSLVEAYALNFADNVDAKIQIATEEFKKNEGKTGWLGNNRFLGSNLRRTTEY